MSEKENTLVELNIQISELRSKLSGIRDSMTADAILIAEGEAAKARLTTAKREYKTMDSELAGVAGNTGYPAGEQRTWHRVPDQWLGQEGGGDIDSGTREH